MHSRENKKSKTTTTKKQNKKDHLGTSEGGPSLPGLKTEKEIISCTFFLQYKKTRTKTSTIGKNMVLVLIVTQNTLRSTKNKNQDGYISTKI